MPISQSLPICFLLLGVGANAPALAVDSFTCLYEVRIEKGILSDVPWSANVQVGVGEVLSYSICVVGESVMFALIDEEADVVYCGVIRDGEVELSHKWDGVFDWEKSHLFTGGFCHQLDDLPAAERAVLDPSHIFLIGDEFMQTTLRVGAITPSVVNFTLQPGIDLQPELLPASLAELHATFIMGEADQTDAARTDRDEESCRCSLTLFAEEGIVSSGPWEDTLHVCVDSSFSCRLRNDRGNESFTLVDRSAEIVYEGRIKEREIRLSDRYHRSERGESDLSFLELRSALEVPVVSSSERIVAVVEYVCLVNLIAGRAAIEADNDHQRRMARYAMYVTQVELESGGLEWQDENLPSTMGELHQIVSEMEPPHRPWWRRFSLAIDIYQHLGCLEHLR